MAIRLKNQMKMQQGLVMTKELQQSIQILTLAHHDLKTCLEEAAQENPLLELEEFPENLEGKNFEIPIHNNSNSSNRFEDYTSTPVSLKDHLLWQVQMDSHCEKDKKILQFLISHLDEQGYLRIPFEDLIKKEPCSKEEFERVLKILQNMDPIGVGARSLKEFLLIQATHLEEAAPNSYLQTVIENHLPHLEKKKYDKISEALKVSPKEIIQLEKIISLMSPVPAGGFSSGVISYATPDVYIYKKEQAYQVSLNKEGLPNLKISSNSSVWLKQKKASQLLDYVKTKTQEAKWLIQSLAKRESSIKKVTESLVRFQKDFLDYGTSGLQPLSLAQVAADVGLHASTVSRITSNKYAHTPQGFILLKKFFSKGISNNKGQSVAVEIIKEKLKAWVLDECKHEPLSDSYLQARINKEFNTSLTRRTIAQYRDSLRILPSYQRKKLG